jgi:hypothetical protein
MVRDKKRDSTPLNKVGKRSIWSGLWRLWAGLMLRMYPAFLLMENRYPDFKPGEKVRVRVIGGASTSG